MCIQAKAYLCFYYKVMWNDPKWDSYTAEEMLIEYFMITFMSNPKYKETYEGGSGGGTMSKNDFAEWATKKSKPLKIEEDFSK